MQHQNSCSSSKNQLNATIELLRRVHGKTTAIAIDDRFQALMHR
jgi:hypothetical protein